MIIGIDPGLSGAAGAVTKEGAFIGVVDLPVIRDASLAWIDGADLWNRLTRLRDAYRGDAPIRVVIERVSAFPGQGVSSCFSFGCTFGSILGALRVLQYPIEFVTPRVWKAALGLGGKAAGPTAAKRAALDKARLMFPQADLSLAKHEGRAEALLIAAWAQRQAQQLRGAA